MNNMINIEGEEQTYDQENSPSPGQNDTGDAGGNEDQDHDRYVKNFLKDLTKVGPYSKQILNYSYPPLLYQRGDDSDEDEDNEEDEEEVTNS